MKKNFSPLVSVVIPTFQEKSNITSIIKKTKKIAKIYDLEIIVADGGSSDGTVTLAKKAGADVVLEFPWKRGKGIDFWEACLNARGKYIVQIDADHQFDPEQIPLFVESLKSGADVAIANRDYSEALLLRTLGNHIVSILASIVLKRRIYDMLAGFKAIRKDVLLPLKLKEKSFMYEVELVAKAVRMGFKLDQIPVSYKKRMREVSQVNLVKDGLLQLKSVIYYGLLVPPPALKKQSTSLKETVI